MNDARLAGDGLAKLTRLLARAFPNSDTIVRIATEGGLEESDVPSGTVLNIWSSVVRTADARTNAQHQPLLDQLLAAAKLDLEAGGARIAHAELNAWLARPERLESVVSAARELLARADALEDLGDVWASAALLTAVRGAAVDIGRGVDQGALDQELQAAEPLVDLSAVKDEIAARCRQVKSSADRLQVALGAARTGLQSRRDNTFDDRTFAMDDSVQKTLLDVRDLLEADLRRLRLVLTRHLPSLRRDDFVGG
jgi:hypothetical protein